MVLALLRTEWRRTICVLDQFGVTRSNRYVSTRTGLSFRRFYPTWKWWLRRAQRPQCPQAWQAASAEFVDTILSSIFGGILAAIRGSQNPGALLATRIWRRASSFAQVTVMAAPPAFAAKQLVRPTLPARERLEMLIMTPPLPPSIICAAASRLAQKDAPKVHGNHLVEIVQRPFVLHLAVLSLDQQLALVIPALLITHRRCQNPCGGRRTATTMACSSVTSAA